MADFAFQHTENWSLAIIVVFTETVKEHLHVLTGKFILHLRRTPFLAEQSLHKTHKTALHLL